MMISIDASSLIKMGTMAGIKDFLDGTQALLRETKPHSELIAEAQALGQLMEDMKHEIWALVKQLETEVPEAFKVGPANQYKAPNFVLAYQRQQNNSEDQPIPDLALDMTKLRNGSKPGYYIGTTSINGVHFHVEAVEVMDNEHGVQMAVHPESAEHFDEFSSLSECQLDTIEHDGRSYIVVIHPHGR